jgi:hypothetical protein
VRQWSHHTIVVIIDDHSSYHPPPSAPTGVHMHVFHCRKRHLLLHVALFAVTFERPVLGHHSEDSSEKVIIFSAGSVLTCLLSWAHSRRVSSCDLTNIRCGQYCGFCLCISRRGATTADVCCSCSEDDQQYDSDDVKAGMTARRLRKFSLIRTLLAPVIIALEM